MRVYYNKTLRSLCLIMAVLLTVLLTKSALAAYYSGSVTYDVDWNGNTLTGYIDFAVYDDRSDFEDDFSYAGLSAPGEGDYVYAYLVTQDSDSESAISYFAILGLDEEASNITGFGALDDDNGGIQPSDYGFTEDDGYWKWSTSYGYIQADERSWLLVFSSDYDWVAGDYEIHGTEDEFPEPGDDGDGDVPEPSLVALFSLGGGAALLRRRKR